jgi:hypothetical protein
MLDARIVPATTSFDPRLLLARGAAERAITGGGLSPSLNAFNAFNRFVNTFDRIESLAQTRLNRIANLFATRVNDLNSQFVSQVLATANGRLGDLGGPGQVVGDAFLNQFNTANTGLALVPGVGFVSTGQLGDLGGPGQVVGDAFLNRFNAQVNRLNNQLTSQLNSLNRVVNSQLNRLGSQVTRAGAPFDDAFTNLRSVFTTQLSTTNDALREGLTGTGTLFSNAFSNFNTLVQNPALSTAGFNQFATDLGSQFSDFTTQFSAGLDTFNTAFSTSFADFNQGFSSGLGSFFDNLNSQFITPSSGFGTPSTGVTFVRNPGFFPGGSPTTTTTF